MLLLLTTLAPVALVLQLAVVVPAVGAAQVPPTVPKPAALSLPSH